MIIPLILRYGLEYFRRARKSTLVLLLFTIIAGIGFSPQTIVIGPMAAGLIFLGGLYGDGKRFKKLVLLGLPMLALLGLVALLLVYWGVDAQPLPGESLSTYKGIVKALGNGPRMVVALLSLLVTPLVLTGGRVRRIMTAYCVAALVIMLNPWLSPVLGRYTSVSTFWRITWIVPFPALAACMLAGIRHHAGRERKAVARTAIGVLLLCGYAALPGTWVMSRDNNLEFGWPRPKIVNQEKVEFRRYGKKTARVINGRIVTDWGLQIHGKNAGL